ncbi:TetR/AcrR family transcriptional regulator [Fulvivirgaceae bacterium BMA10]|uniref:TetR/AcrR family transcriptional regulator n=1 Tax=Splendidivirga corallicola TaxID=3051826 RepID=A0ABT8KN40_9BACT|nr:TetR/AcrR family transcriptional regulator [Fulvivirgaceae bacterium BMA10]
MIIEKKLSRKEQLELAATELFKEKGYAASSMRDLANKLGIEAASLYSHIKSKEEILSNICFRMANEFFEAINKIEIENISASAKLERAIIAHTQVIIKNVSASSVFLHEWRHLNQPKLDEFIAMREDYQNKFISIIEEGIANDEFISIDAKFAVLTILSSLNWIHNWYDPNGKMSPLEIGQQLSRMSINGLKIRF